MQRAGTRVSPSAEAHKTNDVVSVGDTENSRLGLFLAVN